MKIKIIISSLALLFLSFGLGFAQTADDLVAQGRVFLGAKDIVNANARFASAVGLSPNHPNANALYAITRIAALPSTPAAQNFMNRIGLESAGRDIYHWTAQFSTDTNGVPLAPAGVSANEGAGFFRTNVLTAVTGAQNNLSKIVNTNFLLNLSSNETAMAAVTLDYGDIQVLRSLLHGFEYFIYTMNAQNLDVQLSTLRNLYINNQFSFERLLQDYPQLLTFATTNDFLAAETAFRNGVDQYLEASSFIWNRSPDVTRLFNLSPDDSEAEENFRLTLTDLKASLAGAVVLSTDTNYVVYLGSQFTGNSPLRSLLPTIRDNSFGLATWPDLTFGNLISGITGFMADDFLAGFLDAIPTLGNATSTGNQVQIPLNVVKGRGYVVQASTDLVNWMDISTFFATSQLVIFTDSAMGVFQHRFYRVVDRTENMPPPSNNNFEARTAISGSGVTVIGYNVNAGTQFGEPNHYYGSAAGKSVWWSWTAPVSGEFVISTAGSSFQPVVAVYTGTTVSSLSLRFVDQGEVRFSAQGGVTYQIAVDGIYAVDGFYYYFPDSGTIQLTITQPPVINILTPFDGAVFVEHTDITVNAMATDSDGTISHIVFNNNGSPIRFDNVNSASLFFTNAQAGVYYLEVIATDNFGVSSFSSVSFRVAPQNDNFANAFLFSGNSTSVTGTTMGASNEPNEPHFGYGYHSVWYTWTPSLSGSVTISARFTNANGYVPALAIYSGTSVSDLTVVTNNSYSGVDFSSQVSFSVLAGETYKISVEGGYYDGQFTLQVIPTAAPSVNFTTPLNDAVFLVGDNIEMNAIANDSDGYVTQVEFFVDGVFSLGTDVASPYSLIWSNVPYRYYGQLTAVATDNIGAKSADIIYVTIVYPPPVNDNFANAISLSGTSVSASGSNHGATLEAGEPADPVSSGSSVWWSWTAQTNGKVTLTVTTDFMFGHLVGIYTGNSVSSLTTVGVGYNNPSTLLFSASAGTTYYFAVDGLYGMTGNIDINLAPTVPPANDNFENPTILTGLPVNFSGNNLGATKEPGEPDHFGIVGGSSVWWAWTAQTNGFVKVTMFSDIDIGACSGTGMAIYNGNSISALTVVENGGGCLDTIYLSFYAVAGTKYFIAVDAVNGYTGNINLNLNAVPPANDNFENAIILTGLSGAFSMSNRGATKELDEPDHSYNVGGSSIWWAWTAETNRLVHFRISSDIAFGACGGSLAAIYTGDSVSGLTLVTNGGGNCDYIVDLSFYAAAGTTYYIATDAVNGSGGNIDLYLTLADTPTNDRFENATVLTGLPTSSNGNNRNATKELGEPEHSGALGGNSVWWSWTAQTSGSIQATISSDIDIGACGGTLASIYTGNSVSALTVVTDEAWNCISTIYRSFSATAGTTYYIAVDGVYGYTGNITLALSAQ